MSLEATGWNGVEVGSGYDAAKAALTANRVPFEEAKSRIGNNRVLKPKREGWSANTIAFEKYDKKEIVSSLTFVKENASQAIATQTVMELEKRHGEADEKIGPKAMDTSTETTRIWKNAKTNLKLTVRLYADGTMSVIETWVRPT